jgi:DUF1680 family protein
MKARLSLIFLALTLPCPAAPLPPALRFPPLSDVRWDGVLGDAITASCENRLKHFIVDETSVPIALFSEEQAEKNTTGRYWGEHAGKWLFAASRAAARTGDAALAGRVRHIADYLVSTQRPDGYIGTYPAEWRFMRRQQELTRGRWDVWVTAYTMMGLLEVNRHFPDDRYVAAVRKLADLCWRTFSTGGIDITKLSNHFGLSATILLEPVADLYALTGEHRYLDLANLIVRRADDRPEFGLVKKSLAGADVQSIAGGKAYQLCWQYYGVAKLYAATGDARYLRMAENVWQDIRAHHLTLGGGPWGGIGVHREVFNRGDFFSPYGYVETCSIMSWIQLNRELLGLTGQAVYAEEIEKAAYNALLGAQDEDGGDWCYYTFPNGRRVNTSEWKCCKSSGAMALEELTPVAYALRGEREIAVNLYGPNRATLRLPAAGAVAIRQRTRYPFDAGVRLTISPERAADFTLALRIPSWAKDASIAVNGQPVAGGIVPGDYARVTRTWRRGDEISLMFPMHPVLHRQTNQSLQDTNLRKGSEKIMQAVMRYDYVAVTRGPLVYATELIDGFKPEETLRLPREPKNLLEEIAPAAADGRPAIRLTLGYRPPLVFHPYFAAGGRHDGAWRLTWMQVTTD